MAWLFILPDGLALLLTAGAWLTVPLTLSSAPVAVRARGGRPHGMAMVAGLSFAVCLAPPGDVFLYRQHVLGALARSQTGRHRGLQSFQQPLISIAGTAGWLTCTMLYRRFAGAGALRSCLLLWPCALLGKAGYSARRIPQDCALNRL